MAKAQKRILITNDNDGHWFIRRVKFTSHDLDADEKVYRCDKPIGERYDSLDEAVFYAKRHLGKVR